MAVHQKISLLSFHSTALILSLLPSLFSTGVSGILTSVDCRWPDGTDSNGRIPCNPHAERSACCLGSEVCLENNLCFGGVGLVYRSACAGGWGDNQTCPDFCNDLIPKKWANIWPCPGKGEEGPTQYWCGFGNVCDTTVTVNSSFFLIDNYKFQARSIIGGSADSPLSVSANANASSNTACSTSSPTKCPDSDKKPVLAVGAGVGVPLALLALGLGSWAMVERRKRKVLASGMAYNGVNGNLQPPDVGILGKRGDKAELAAISPYRNNSDAYSTRHELQ